MSEKTIYPPVKIITDGKYCPNHTENIHTLYRPLSCEAWHRGRSSSRQVYLILDQLIGEVEPLNVVLSGTLPHPCPAPQSTSVLIL